MYLQYRFARNPPPLQEVQAQSSACLGVLSIDKLLASRSSTSIDLTIAEPTATSAASMFEALNNVSRSINTAIDTFRSGKRLDMFSSPYLWTPFRTKSRGGQAYWYHPLFP